MLCVCITGGDEALKWDTEAMELQLDEDQLVAEEEVNQGPAALGSPRRTGVGSDEDIVGGGGSPSQSRK